VGIAAVLGVGCGAGAERPAVPIDTFKTKDATVVAISASGATAVLRTQDFVYGKPQDYTLVERVGGKPLGKGKGWLVGRPSDREAYVLAARQLTAMVSGKTVALALPELPAKLDWEMTWSTIDHAAGIAVIAFHETNPTFDEQADADRDRGNASYLIVEVDLAAMSQRGATPISILGSKMSIADTAALIDNVEKDGGAKQRVYGSAPLACSFANTLDVAQLYLTCRVPEDSSTKPEHWVTTRYDGRTLVWTHEFEAPETIGGGNVAGALTGDGKTLVLAHGDMSYGLIDAETTVLQDATTGVPREIARTRENAAVSLGKVAGLVPVPGTSTVAQVHRYEPAAHSGGDRAFDGISVLDATTGDMKVVLDTSRARRDLRHSVPDVVIVLPNGTYLLGI
jgi:hypothetical protein